MPMAQDHSPSRFHLSALSIALDALRFLATNALTSSENTSTDNSAKGGRLNYRTGQLDDGTQASGWYDIY